MHIKDTAPAAHDHGGGLRFDFAGTRVLVTGGTRGIGKAIVDKFVDAGAQVVVAARRPGEDADEQPSRHFVCTDVTNPDSIGALAERGLEILGGLDVLVNNAGRQSWTPNGTLGISDEQWRTDFDTNLM
jgi:NAD(P)-dependent dehydrogenase (short-subunit alcohol dehydrogenase family)